MDKFKMASSSFGERLKTGGAQMTRLVSSKMKDLLQAPTPESKMVEEATLESMDEPNWGLNLRICAMINAEEFSGTEIVKAIKKKLTATNSRGAVVSQRLSLDLLEACTSNCEKVFSEVASEKLLDDMVKVIEDPGTDHGNRERCMQLIRAWGESEDLMYLPVFRQSYTYLKENLAPGETLDGNSPPEQYTLDSYVNQETMSPPERYPIIPNDMGRHGADNTTFPYGSQSVEESKEFLVITRNSLDILSSILNSEEEPKVVRNDLTVSMLEKCKQSLPVVQRIAESTTDDEVMLFDALNLHDELQQILSRCEGMEASLVSDEEPTQGSDAVKVDAPVIIANHTEIPKSPKAENTESRSDRENAGSSKEENTKSSSDMKRPGSPKAENTESNRDMKKSGCPKEENVERSIGDRSSELAAS